MLFTVCILGASSYETRRANDTASILVVICKGRLQANLCNNTGETEESSGFQNYMKEPMLPIGFQDLKSLIEAEVKKNI